MGWSVGRAHEGGADAKLRGVADQWQVSVDAEIGSPNGRRGVETDSVAFIEWVDPGAVEVRLQCDGPGDAVKRQIAERNDPTSSRSIGDAPNVLRLPSRSVPFER